MEDQEEEELVLSFILGIIIKFGYVSVTKGHKPRIHSIRG
jgi:hypothetical protein